MIEIIESTPIKISGLSSFLVQTNGYNEAAINKIKELPFSVYHKKLQLWEVPAEYLADLLDKLTDLDDIKLQLLDDTKPDQFRQPPLTEKEISEFKVKPFPHQVEAINYGLEHSKWLLLDSMGLGKTLTIMYLAETLHKRGLIDHCLIISGIDGLRQHWKKEIKKFSNESVLVLGEKITKTGTIRYDTVPNRIKQLENKIDEFFVIVNIATMRSDEIVEVINKAKVNKFGMIAFDECHKSTKSSQQGSNIIKLKADYKVGATGTILVRNPISAYGPLVFTENDHATLTNFKSFYCEFGGFNGYQIVGFKNLETLKEEIESCSIRRTLDQVKDNMPEKLVTQELVELSDEHKKFYEAIKEGVKEEADKIDLKASNLLALTTRLRQATACPGILTSQDIISTKVERCVEIVEELMDEDEKVVIMSTFKDPVYQLAKMLEKYKPLVNTGDVPDDVCNRNVEQFQTDPNSKVFIGTIAKCSTGITLNAASYMIMLDEDWSYANNAQCQDRIWRVTNTRPAFITVLTAKDTIDEHVHQVSQDKKDLSDYMIDNKPSERFTDQLREIIRGL